MSTADCIFCNIASGKISARRIFEDGACAAFLDVAPLSPGHALLVPKIHCDTLESMPAEVAAAMLRHLPALGRAILAATGAEGFNVLLNSGPAAGQVVMHAHFHIIPRRRGDGLGYRWQPQSLCDAEADAIRGRVAAAMLS